MRNELQQKLAKIPQNNDLKINVEEKLKTLKEERSKDFSNAKIKVSLQFFSKEVKEFNLGSAEQSWFIAFLETIKLLSSITKKQLFSEYKMTFQPHPYNDIEKLNYKDIFLTNPQCEAWQLRISKSKGRIHGFFVDDVFYIRFLDNDHNMYDDKRYGGVTYSQAPKTPYDIVLEEKICLEEQNKLLLEKSNKNYNMVCSNCMECPKGISEKFEF